MAVLSRIRYEADFDVLNLHLVWTGEDDYGH